MAPRPLPDAFADLKLIQPFSAIKLVVLDLDGTLLFSATDSPETGEWTRRSSLTSQLGFRGVKLTVATGRTFEGARKVIESVCKRSKVPVIVCNGSVVMTTKGQVLDFESIPNSSVKHVAQLLDQVGGQAFVYVLSSQTSADGAASRIEVVHYIGSDKVPMTDFNGMRVQLGLPQSSADVTVAMLVVASQTNRLNSLVDLLTNVPGISLTRSGTAYIEVRPMNSTKALGLARVLSALSVDRQNVMAIGDNDNDVEMLEFCGLAVSVANASPKAKAVSQYVTERSAADGVVEVLDLLKRVKRLSN